ncbi:hypothetical protein [Bartonella sp. AD13SXNS]
MVKKSFIMGKVRGISVFMVSMFLTLKDGKMPIGGCYFTGSDEKLQISF